jgi:hypothetical protein
MNIMNIGVSSRYRGIKYMLHRAENKTKMHCKYQTDRRVFRSHCAVLLASYLLS